MLFVSTNLFGAVIPELQTDDVDSNCMQWAEGNILSLTLYNSFITLSGIKLESGLLLPK